MTAHSSHFSEMKKHNIKPKTPLITDSSQALATTSTISFPQIPHLLLHIDELYFFLLPAAIPVSRQPPPSPSPSSAHRQTDASPRQTNATARNPSTADRRSPLQAAPSSSSSQHPPPTAPGTLFLPPAALPHPPAPPSLCEEEEEGAASDNFLWISWFGTARESYTSDPIDPRAAMQNGNFQKLGRLHW